MTKDVISEIIGKNVRNLRLKRNISLQVLSCRVHISAEKLDKLEKGEYLGFGFSDYLKIARGLDAELKEIIKGIQFLED